MMTVLADTFMIATRLEPRGPQGVGGVCRRSRPTTWAGRLRRWGLLSAG